MKHPIIQSLITFKDLTLLQALHGLVGKFLKARGYRWAVRRSGEVKLGYWCKTLHKKNRRNPYPKRFVLIPGFGDSPLSWYPVIVLLNPILKQHFDEIIFLDFPGFAGFLSREKSFPSMDFMMKMLCDTLDSLKPHTILGHSLGGWLTAQYAAFCGSGQRPVGNKLNYSGPHTILLASPSGVFPDEKTKNEWASIFIQSREQGFSALRPHLFLKEPSWFRWIVPYFSRFIQREDVHQFMDSFRDDHELSRLIHTIRSKVWLIWGEKDTLIPPSCAHGWFRSMQAEKSENHHAVMLQHSGHSPHIEVPAVTAAVIGQILTQKVPHRLGKRWWKVLKNEALPLL